MQGIYYLVSIVALFIVFIWYIRNDGLPEGEPTRGLLAMKEPTVPPLGQKRKDRARNADSSSASTRATMSGPGRPLNRNRV